LVATRTIGSVQPAPLHHDESRRLGTLRALDLLDTQPEEEFEAVTRLAQRFLGVPIALITLVDESRQWFKSSQGLAASETPRDLAFCAHAIVSDDDVFVVENALIDERFADNPLVTHDPSIRFYAGAKLTAGDGMPVGTLCVIDSAPRSLSPDDLAVLRDLAEIVERQLAARLLATLDPLTGLRNRRAIRMAGDLLFGLADRAGTTIALAFLDADRFKAINDTHGHDAGDGALREIAAVLGDVTRSSDVIGRLGGDEFIAVLSDTDAAGAAEVLRRMDALLAAAGRLGSRQYDITLSAGVVERLPGGSSFGAALVDADAALYKAKASRTG
jgi:diguanylate cyclase (GGDEF)-like protein